MLMYRWSSAADRQVAESCERATTEDQETRRSLRERAHSEEGVTLVPTYFINHRPTATVQLVYTCTAKH